MSEKANVDLMKGSSGSKACSLCMISLSLIFCALSGVASIWLPKVINDAIVDSGTICDASDDGFKDYVTPENSITENWYFYTWEEADAIAFSKNTAGAKVKEIGPFTWDKKTYTYDVTFADGKMKYTDATVYIYNEAESGTGVSLNDEIVLESLGYQSLITGALTEGTLVLSGVCSADQIKNIGASPNSAVDFLKWAGWDGAAGPSSITPAVDDAPNSFCFPPSTAGKDTPFIPLGANKVPASPELPPACICCIPNALEGVWAGIAKPTLDALGRGYATTAPQTCNSYAQNPTVNGLIDLLALDDRALTDDDTQLSKFFETPVGGKFPVSPTFHKITVREFAFGYASALTGFFLTKSGVGGLKASYPAVGDLLTVINTAPAAERLKGIGLYSKAVHTSCVMSTVCNEADAIDFIVANGIDYNAITEDGGSAVLGALVGSALNKVLFGIAECKGEINLATMKAYGVTHDKIGYLDIDGMNCLPASTGYAVANHYCGMREDWLDGDGKFGTSLIPAAAVPTIGTTTRTKRDEIGCRCIADPGTDNTVGVGATYLQYAPVPFSKYPTVIGCCLVSGFNAALGGDLTGYGCLVPIPGRVPGQRDDLILAKAANSSPPKYNTRTTGCKAGDEENAWNQVIWEEKTEYSAYVKGLENVVLDQPSPSGDGSFYGFLPLKDKQVGAELKTGLKAVITQKLIDDLKYLPTPYMMNDLITEVTATNLVTSAVNGGNGAQIPPQGLDTRSFGGAHLNDNVAVKKSFVLWESNSKIGLAVSNVGASVVKEIPTQRYELDADALHGAGTGGVRSGTNADIGVGFPWDGIVPFAWERAAPVAISQPNFFNGKNGGKYVTTGRSANSDPLLDKTITIGGVEIKNTKGETLTQSDIDADSENYQTYFDVEISTGKTFKVNQRLQLNSFFGACHDSQSECGLINQRSAALKTTPKDQLESIYNVRTPDMQGDVIVPLYRLDRNAEIKDDSADAFKGLEKIMQLADIGSIICLLFGVVLGLFGIVKCMQN